MGHGGQRQGSPDYITFGCPFLLGQLLVYSPLLLLSRRCPHRRPPPLLRRLLIVGTRRLQELLFDGPEQDLRVAALGRGDIGEGP